MCIFSLKSNYMPSYNGINPEGPQPETGGGSSGGGSEWIAAGINLISGLIQSNQNEMMAEHQNQWSKDAASLANQRDIENWNRQNEYNSPAAQRARLEAAGINPSILGASGGSSGNATSPPPSKVPGIVGVPGALNAVNIPGILDQYQDFRLRQAQIDNVEAQTDNVRNRTITESLTQGLKRIMGDREEIKLGVEDKYSMEMGHYNLQQAQKTVRNLGQKWALMDEQSQINALVMDQRRQALTESDARIEKIKAETMFKQNENQWRAAGITSSDNLLLRMLIRILPTEEYQRSAKKMLKY